MLDEVKKSLPVDLAVCAAAVTDFKPIKINQNKIKKENLNLKSISFVKNNDILEYISKSNKNRPRLVAGFSAETENLTKNSINKINKKHCDLIFANDISKKDIGFNSNYNKVSVIDRKGNIKIIPKNKKSFIANKIAEILLDKLLIDDRNTN
jgi:phosphopantothenoylcysteine decarboxylase/phosphopantothenate--cysteine ligase